MGDVWSVQALTSKLHGLVEAHYGDVWVAGELSNVNRAASGHCYFTLKDDAAQIQCVMWRYRVRHLPFEPSDGDRVQVRAAAGIYEKRGQLQLMVQVMKPAGRGAQQAAFEQLKATLKAEGLFAAERKQSLPSFPHTVGIVTSGSGAAFHDMRTVLQRRYPLAQVVLCPVPVQGTEAPTAIARAIRRFDALPASDARRPDVLLVGRGGGSTEDLWAFNEEGVARAIAEATVPIISAVGHETDVSIADFVADARAATPSMAAEIAVPDQQELREQVRGLHQRMRANVHDRVRTARGAVERLVQSRAFHSPVTRLHNAQQRLDHLVDRLQRAGRAMVRERRQRVATLQQQLRSLDPEAPLRRGYALVQRDGTVVPTAAAAEPGTRLTLRFADGTRVVEVQA
ncbi:exodeoxyribonuclease VII large subunit [Salisaeta longa]|uniref:exodeoxyribonuclease VII large subunit n=1 Tax=Salisaeta longa TaxID=503170 RepID=UPI0003B568FD|nr:exodeoxyribonuclease VII large subunit [Salisaeta longa]